MMKLKWMTKDMRKKKRKTANERLRKKEGCKGQSTENNLITDRKSVRMVINCSLRADEDVVLE